MPTVMPTVMPNLGYVIFYVADVEASVAFYERAFGLTRRFVSPDNDYGELDTGATTLSFASSISSRLIRCSSSTRASSSRAVS